MTEIRNTLSQIYFYELDARDKIFSRLQLNFVIYASAIALLAYMARMADYDSSCIVLTLFYTGLATGATLLGLSVYQTTISLTGYKYKTLPKANDIICYGNELEERAVSLLKYNQDYKQSIIIPDPHAELDKYFDKALSDCIDHNYAINEYRRQVVRKSIWTMILAAVPVIFSSALFVFYDLDTSSPRKVSTSFADERPLVNSIRGLEKIIIDISTEKSKTEMPKMTNDQENQNSNSSKPQTPPPPPEPRKPELQYSTEDLKAPLPTRTQILTEDK